MCHRHSGLIGALIISLVYLPAAFDACRSRPMWHDELYTFYISQQPGVGAMWHAIRSFDLNPPLSYLLTRLSFHIFGINTLATRLPEIISFLVFLLSIFFFARRRLGTLFGLFVTAALLQTDTFSFSVEARPYALMLAGTGVALLSWQTAVDAHRTGRRPRAWLRKLAVAGLFAAVITLVLGHLFGIAVLFVLALAELFRARQRGALDWPLTLALVSPLLLLATCIPMLRSHAHAMYPAAFLPDLDTINDFYGRSFAFQLAGLCIAAIAVHLPFGRRICWFDPSTAPATGSSPPRSGSSSWGCSPSRWSSSSA